MNLVAQSRKDQDLVDLQGFIQREEYKDPTEQSPVPRRFFPWGVAQSLQEHGGHEQQQPAEQRRQVQLSVHVQDIEPVFIGTESIHAHLRDGVGHQKCRCDQVQPVADRVGSHEQPASLERF